MNVNFHPDAAAELEEAFDYYEDCQIGLGKQLIQEVETATQLVQDYPLAWAIVGGSVRRMLIRRFPFGLLYSVNQNEIFILAVMHLNREPNYWKNRT